MIVSKLHLLVLAICLTVCSVGRAQTKLSETYQLDQPMPTSAGVYDSDGVLLRTLWSNVEQSAGTHSTPLWDGLDDFGVDVSSQGASIQVVANDIQVNWDGVIGNLSDSFTENIHKELHFYRDMLIHDNTAYFASGWTEGAGSVITSSLDSMGVTKKIMPSRIQQMTERIATDGVRLYMAGRLGGTANISYVQAAMFSNLDDFEKYETFQGDTVNTGPRWGNYTFKAANIVDSYQTFPNPNNDNALELAAPHVTGLAVQTSGDYLFIARERLNSLHILHKVSGELLHSLTFDRPKHTKIDDQGDLWMVHDDATGNEVIERFTVNETTGAITSTGFKIEGSENVQAMTFNSDHTTLAVADATDAAHLVKGYNTSTGAQRWALGREESYKDVATVHDDKFMFAFNTDDDPYISGTSEYARGYKDEYSFLVYENDGSLWVNDRGNFRYQKFNPVTGEYLDQMMWQRGKYGLSVDPNDPQRVFYDYLEFEVNYDKPLRPKNENKAWRLVNNWAGGIPVGRQSWSQALKDVTTLSNGRTYGLIPSGNEGIYEIIELVDGGTVRQTNVYVGSQYGYLSLKADGSLRQAQGISGVQYFYQQAITGFDEQNNPTLGPETIWSSYAEVGNYVKQDGARRVSGEFTENGNLVLFDGGQRTQSGSGFHLAAWNKDLGRFAFKTAREVDLEYRRDPYPSDGSYDMRDEPRIQYRGNVALAMDDWIVWGYNGEFWEQRQTNKWHMVTQEGLFLRDFGVATDARFQLPAHTAGMAGNAFTPKIVKAGSNNNVYLWHNDESYHAGAHRWEISNLQSIIKFDLKICSDTLGNPNSNCDRPTFKIGGTVSGLSNNNQLVLTNNDGDALTINSNGQFMFNSPLQNGQSFNVVQANHINDQTCSISNANGTVESSAVTNINIQCISATPSYTIGGHVYGLSPDQSLVLSNNGEDELIVTKNGAFSFATPLSTGSPYSISIESQPADLDCEFSTILYAVSPTGNVRTGPVDGVIVNCHKVFATFTETPINPSVISFTLVDADTGQDMATYAAVNGNSQATVSIADTPNISVRVNTTDTNRVALSGLDSGPRTENIQPFSLLGDDDGVYQPWSPLAGEYAISATPYFDQQEGQTATLKVTVMQTTATPPITTPPKPDTMPILNGEYGWLPAVTDLLLNRDS